MTNPIQEPLNVKYWSDILKPVFEGKKVILAGGVVAGQLPRARQIKQLGAQSTFILATEGMGTGETPTAEDGEWIAIDPPHSNDLVDAIHAGNAILSNLPKHVQDALDLYDPDHTALVVGTFLHEQESVAERKSLAYRKTEWLALDDKTVIDKVWDKIGVTREPSEVVRVDRTALLEASKRIDTGGGVVWSSDSREGVSGGAVGVRWIRTETDANKALEYFKKNCDQLRVMPFMEGIPCSIHGIVFPDYVVALRPVEMVVMRISYSNEFFYAGTATYWDPATSDREYMRNMAKRVGNALRDMVDYLGIFTVDGVLTKDGFRPTEMNTRSGAGIKPLITELTDDLPLELVVQAMASGAILDYKPVILESLIISSADKHRSGGTWKALSAHLPKMDKRPIKLTENGWEWAKDVDSDGTVSVGPGPLGSFVRLTPNSSSIKAGNSFAPLARDFWRFFDENMGSKVGALETAKSVR